MQSWHDEFIYMKKTVDWGVLTYTMHPYVIGRGYRMLALEDLVAKLAADGAVFMTMEQAAEEAKAEAVWLAVHASRGAETSRPAMRLAYGGESQRGIQVTALTSASPSPPAPGSAARSSAAPARTP